MTIHADLDTALDDNETHFLRAVLDNMKDGVVTCDPRGMLTFSNRAARELHGLGERAVPPELWAESFGLYMPDGKTLLRPEDNPLFRALRGEKLTDVEMVIAPPGRLPRAILANGQPLFDSRGQQRGAIVSLHDVSERRRTEADLRRERALVDYIINFVPHSIFWKDRAARFMGCNRNVLDDFHLTSVADVVGKTDYDLFPKEQAEYFRSCDFAVMDSGKALLDIEEPQDRPGRGTRVNLTSKVPLRDETGEVIGMLGSYTDITDRKRMEEELRAATRAAEAAAQAKSDLLATVSHELRTPLTLILGPLAMILASKRDGLPEGVRADLERVQSNAIRLHSLVDDVLGLARLEAGKALPEWELVDVGAVVAAIATDVAAAARAKDVALSFTNDEGLRRIPLDRSMFETIALNLLGNAVKFTPRGGTIRVNLRALGDRFELSVTDSGIGIAPDQQKLLFQRFRQLASSAPREYEGTGLGLAIVKELAELMDGEVGVESVPGQGSTFFVRFSRVAERAMTSDGPSRERSATLARRALAAPAPPRVTRPRGHPTGPRVLVVDDNADMRAYLIEILQDEYDVTTADNGVCALEVARVWRPDVIVSDIMMPTMDGLELVTRLKAAPDLSGIPVILLTAKTSGEEVVTGLESGADDYLGKPFGPAELRARVRAAHRLFQALARAEAALRDLRQSQEQLVHASKMAAVGTMIAGLSHELNNPLAAISLNTELLSTMDDLDAPAARRALQRISMQTDRCARLVRSLVDYSRREAAVVESTPAEEVVSQVLQLATPLAQRRGVALELIGDPSSVRGIRLPMALEELETSLLNLVSNALAATRPGGSVALRVEVSRRADRKGVELTVVDTGRGIPADVLPRIFDPFFTTTAPGEGTGLGLAITRKIVESHDGEITVESEAGRGTSARIWIPFEGAPGERPA